MTKRWRWGVPNVEFLRDRHGHPRWYFRVDKGPRTALPDFGSAQFRIAWEAAKQAADGLAIEPVALGATRTRPGTVSAALVAYYGHADWTDGIGEVSRKKRRPILEKLRAAKGDAMIAGLKAEHLQPFFAKLKPNAQKNWMKALRGFLKASVRMGLIKTDPTQGVVKDKAKRGTGFIAWTEDDLQKYRAHWALGTRQRLAIEIMVNLGLRRADARRIGPADIRNGYLCDFVPQKTENSTGVKLTLPIRPELAEAISAMQVVSTRTYMVGEARGRVGQPFKTPESFGAWMRVQCDAAGLPECTSHGLRKLAAIRLAMAGATVPQLCKVFGWSSPAMAQVYVDQADQMRMAEQAMALLDAPKAGKKFPQPDAKGWGKEAKSAIKSMGEPIHGKPDRNPRRK